jgi:hypothetical protein
MYSEVREYMNILTYTYSTYVYGYAYNLKHEDQQNVHSSAYSHVCCMFVGMCAYTNMSARVAFIHAVLLHLYICH